MSLVQKYRDNIAFYFHDILGKKIINTVIYNYNIFKSYQYIYT